MKEKTTLEGLHDYTGDNYSYNDYLKIRKLFQSPFRDKETNQYLLNHWEEVLRDTEKPDDTLNHIFEKIHYKIILQERRKTLMFNVRHQYRRIAAILFIPVLLVSIWYYISSKKEENALLPQLSHNRIEVFAPDGSRVKFFLPDSTTGWLNSGSTLKYPVFFNKHRKVELTGEAWFDVKHIDDSDFTVDVKDVDVKVLGTKFNVSAYPDDPYTDVVLKDGRVEVIGKTGTFDEILYPNEKISFNHDKKTLNIDKVNADRYSAWKEGYLVIDNEPLNQVISRLERWYNVEIIIEDDVLKKYHFKATFKDEPLEEVLKLLAKTTPINYTIEKRSVNQNGILLQKRVTLKLKQ